MSNKLNEVLEPQKVNNDDLPRKEIKSNLNRKYEGINESIEPSHLSLDIWSYCDNPKDSE
jgi:hypothetical protein